MPKKLTKAQLAKIAEIVALFEEERLAELAVEEDGLFVELKSPAALRPAAETAVPTAGARVRPEHWLDIEAPMTGLFYRGPSPDQPPYVEVGDLVAVGQSVGLIEAMKVFSEIPAPVSGRIVEIAAANGVLVGEGDLLMVVDPGA
jgi:acetyl-CoA carboxylase biotin carboxyl carrier protein